MHIIAIGGGGFSMEPENPLLDDYILSQAGSEKPKMCFLPTAAGDSPTYIESFYEAFRERATCSHLSLFAREVKDLSAFIMAQDIVYVGGGNTVNLIAVWRAHDLDKVLWQAYQNGVILAGLSAGSLCWFESGITDSLGPEMERFAGGLGFLRGSHCPHYESELTRRPLFHQAIAEGMAEGFGVCDGVALHFAAGKLKAAVSSRDRANAYFIRRTEDGVKEETLPVTRLSAADRR